MSPDICSIDVIYQPAVSPDLCVILLTVQICSTNTVYFESQYKNTIVVFSLSGLRFEKPRNGDIEKLD